MDQVSLYTFSPLKTLPACFTMLPTHDADGIARRIRRSTALPDRGPWNLFSPWAKKAGASLDFFFRRHASDCRRHFPSLPRFGVQSGRWLAYVSTIEIIRDYPSLGSGLGTFRWVFPQYRSGDIPSYGVWELEAAAEMGIPFTVVLGIGWLAALAVLFRGMLGRNRDAILPTAAFWIGLLAIPHSQVVFPLQMPGFALPVCSILGMGLAQSFSTRSKVSLQSRQIVSRCTFA